MIDPLVRTAAPADISQLIELEAEARSGLIGARGGDRWLEEHPARDWMASQRDIEVLVGELDSVLVGYLVVSHDGRISRAEQVYVAPWARELGFGDALLATAVEHARDRGAEIFEAVALPGDRELKNLFERAGITARSITVSTRL